MMSDRKSCHDFTDADLERMGVMTVEQCRLDHLERLVLRLLRHFCMTHAQPEGQSWRHAMQDSVFHLGPEAGLTLALAVSDYLDALRAERGAPFNFVDPACPRCTTRIFPVEWAMMAILRSVRRGDYDIVDATLATVLNTNAGATRRAATALAACLQDIDVCAHGDIADSPKPVLH